MVCSTNFIWLKYDFQDIVLARAGSRPRPTWAGKPPRAVLKAVGGTMPACSVAGRHHYKQAVATVPLSAVCGKAPKLRPPPCRKPPPPAIPLR
jgi:hypothetical protein